MTNSCGNPSSIQPATTSLNEYASCDFRVDINLARRSALDTSQSYSIVMELKTTDGSSQRFTFDASNIKLLNQELDKMAVSFPKCYVYK
ncbi:hypothetical protein Ddc_05362 [Ditylenchus destructor]|nr:hypothetical protein Ddc_05362 [Ditylenchus destructor]